MAAYQQIHSSKLLFNIKDIFKNIHVYIYSFEVRLKLASYIFIYTQNIN